MTVLNNSINKRNGDLPSIALLLEVRRESTSLEATGASADRRSGLDLAGVRGRSRLVCRGRVSFGRCLLSLSRRNGGLG